MKKKVLYKKIKKIFLPILVFVSFFALCFSVMYANADTFVNQDAPFIIQGTATNNNTTIDPVGDVAYLVEKRGHSEVVNGEIVDANGNDLVCIGRQQWNEEVVVDDDHLVSSSFSSCVPNRVYYAFCNSSDRVGTISFYDLSFNLVNSYSLFNRSVTSPNNCYYFKIDFEVSYGLIYNNDITISIWYDDEDGYDEYYPYQVLTQVSTGTEVLRSAGNAYDVKTSNGVIVRNIAVVDDLAELDWSYVDSLGYFQCSLPYELFKGSSMDSIVGLLISDNQYVVTSQSLWSSYDYSIACFYTNVSADIILKNKDCFSVGDLENALSGVSLNYQLAVPTQEQGTTFNQVLSVDDFGSMYWLDDDGDLITIPQGNHVTYVYSFVYAWTELIWRIFPEVFKDLGGNVLKFIKDGFVNLFVNQVEVDGIIEYQPSEISYFVFAILGIALICGLTYYIVNKLRRSR